MANEGAVPIDFTSPVGQVRLLIGDTDAVPVDAATGRYVWFSDPELSAFLALYPDPRRAAVSALRTIAPVAALRLKKWSEGALQVDGPAITTALIDLAETIEKGIKEADRAEGVAISTPTGGKLNPMLAMALGQVDEELAGRLGLGRAIFDPTIEAEVEIIGTLGAVGAY